MDSTSMTPNVTDILASVNNQSSTPSSVLAKGFIDRAIALSILFGIISLITILGNIFVIAAIILEPKLRKKQNILIGSLAITDLLVGVLVMPVGVVKEIYSEKWILGTGMCYVWLACHVSCSTASILHLVAIAIDRYWAVSNIKYMVKRNLKRIIAMIVISWSVGWILAVITLFGLDNLGQDRCYINMEPVSAIFSIFLIFYTPVIVMITIYIKIYKVVKTTVQKNKKRKLDKEVLSDLEVRERKREDQANNQERKATITVCIITGTFISCWLPFFVVAMIDNLSPDGSFISSRLTRGLVLWAGYCNSMLNPIIYTVFIEEFRHAFRRILFRNTGNSKALYSITTSST